jgi:acyl-CoA synthetase (AMP-forming)/AMP-acid ligase II
MNIGFIPAKTARLEPAREALIDVHSGRRVSFGQLDENICRLANGFVDQLGLSKGDRVAVLSKNAIEYMEIYYACARVGLIAQPINWRLGTDEIVHILEDGSPSVVISSDEYLEPIKQLKDKVVVAHWLNFGADGDGSYLSLLQGSPSTEPSSSADVDSIESRSLLMPTSSAPSLPPAATAAAAAIAGVESEIARGSAASPDSATNEVALRRT